jgi:ATP-binding cassette subfamily F protein uup
LNILYLNFGFVSTFGFRASDLCFYEFSMSLIGLQDVSISFGDPPLLDKINLQIQPGERVCLIGRNGSGKTTLMKIINGDMEPDSGAVACQQGVTTALLAQEVPEGIKGTVFDVVLSGLGKKGELPAEYHRLSTKLAEESSNAVMKRLDQVQKILDATDGWEVHRQAETIITRMRLNPEAEFQLLSAGLKRRVLLARSLVRKPGILLLDEPTNHLDIDAITRLEEFLMRYEGTLLFVTHDRMLVKRLATRIIELDRGKLSNWNCSYEIYLERKEAALEAEREQWVVFDKKLAKEEDWIRQGVKARLKRDQGRLAALLKMREERRIRREQQGTARMYLQEARRSGKLVIDAEEASFSYDDTPVIRDFTTLIMRRDRVGIIGPNGCGKTTLLRLLLGELTPQPGNLRHGTNLEIVYFDQLRGQLDEDKSVLDNVADGSDRVVLNGKTRHVIGYLQDFLFAPERSRSPVKVLSGGERNRLLLAKLFARPSNLLVMDEPTNDLDIETLELLEELLMNYPGTLLLVSHDRTFLNNVVTSTLVFEGGGKVTEYIGGYDDWLVQKPQPSPLISASGQKEKKKKDRKLRPATPVRPRKLTNKEKEELEKLPRRIEALEEEQERLYQRMAEPAFYQQEGDKVVRANQRLEELKQVLAAAYQRWEELEELQAKNLSHK